MTKRRWTWNVTLSLLQLPWLPIRWRVQFKLCCCMHAVVTGRSPAYLGSIVQPATQSRSGLRPSSVDFSVPRTRTKFGERAFSYAGPSAWNTLPRHIRDTVDSASFRKLLKTHYFTSAFGVAWFFTTVLSPFYIFYINFYTACMTLTSWSHVWSKNGNISTRCSSMKRSGCGVHVFQLAFKHTEGILNTYFSYVWYLYRRTLRQSYYVCVVA